MDALKKILKIADDNAAKSKPCELPSTIEVRWTVSRFSLIDIC